MSDVRAAAVMVAHVLHTPITGLDDAPIDEVLEWADEAAVVLRALTPRKGKSRG